ncbi:glyoxalase superfamily protein [Pelagibacterium sp. 26DY04]|uniref:glyoxalase superfamily protein n=1 Tax=Pelagibacterium sp. 26DY04 TaxID=2967130 RepID=UPI002815191E|nr:glyoxalase superfamily protein [Pelagibacterium sp. 26DY04]WMT88425.1 glyoxalase superfamily protein [Pelagibacterium sp. 26DY04]
MRKPASHLTTTDLKTEARQYRAAQLEAGRTVSHAQALEMVARFHGFRDWNTASGVLPMTRAPAFALSQRISGTYLKQPFSGTIIGLAALGAGDMFRLTVQFDEPVDVVSFESFSAFRQRVEATVTREGVSPSRTSDGEPHMVITSRG